MTICTDRFHTVAEMTRKSAGMPGLPVVYVAHPLAGLKKEEVRQKADAVIEQVIRALTGV